MGKTIIIGNPLVNTYGLARSLSISGHDVILILEPTRFDNIKYSKYVKKVHKPSSLGEIVPLLLKEYGDELEKPVLYCGSDSSVSILDNNYDLLKDKFIFFNAGKQGRINHFMDKVNTFPYAEKNGLSIIKTWVVKPGEDIPSDIVFPCLIKGSNSIKSTKMDMAVCQNITELRTVFKRDVEYLIQEYIPKEYELDIIGLSYNSGKDVYIPATVRKVRDDLLRQSAYFRLDDIEEYPALNIEGIKNFIRELYYEGIFSVEVLYSKGKYYFLEVNLRNDGAAWIYTAAGINYPHLWALYADNKLDNELLNNINGRTPMFLMGEGDIFNLLEGKVSLKKWLHDFHKTGTFDTAYLKDPKYFFSGLFIHFKQACRRLFRK